MQLKLPSVKMLSSRPLFHLTMQLYIHLYMWVLFKTYFGVLELETTLVTSKYWNDGTFSRAGSLLHLFWIFISHVMFEKNSDLIKKMCLQLLSPVLANILEQLFFLHTTNVIYHRWLLPATHFYYSTKAQIFTVARGDVSSLSPWIQHPFKCWVYEQEKWLWALLGHKTLTLYLQWAVIQPAEFTC